MIHVECLSPRAEATLNRLVGLASGNVMVVSDALRKHTDLTEVVRYILTHRLS